MILFIESIYFRQEHFCFFTHNKYHLRSVFYKSNRLISA